jgi:flagellar hook-associated protein 2
MGLSSAGVGSGLDVTNLVSSLMAAEQKPLNALTAQASKYTTKLSSLGTFQNDLATYQATAKALTDSASFQTISASASDNSSVTGSLTSGAVVGNYSLEVNQLAQSQKLVSKGVINASAAVGSGTISFNFGSIQGGSVNNGSYTDATFTNNASVSKTVTIDSSNNTLTGICAAINTAGLGITATLVNDGSSAPNRLILTNTQTGQTQSMSIAVSGAAGLAALLSYDPSNNSGQALSELTKAQDAQLKIDGIVITKSSNTITDAITGVSLSLKKINTGNPTSLSLTINTSTLSTNLNNFISGYNSLIGTITSVTAYDQKTKIGAALYGESSLRAIKNQIRSTLASALPNSGGFTNLNQLGISFQKDGTLALDSSKLQAAIANSYDKVASLFTATGASTDKQISYTSATAATKTGSYAVNISQLASQGTLNGNTAAGLIITAGSNDTLQFTLDGVPSTLTLSAGTYATAGDLVTELQAKINASASFVNAGSSALVSSTSDGKINFISNGFGLRSSISLSGNAASTILGGTGIAKLGVEMKGSINGQALNAVGQYLIGAKGDASEGLTVKILGGGTGPRGAVTYTKGIALSISQLIDTYTSTGGLIAARKEGISASIKSTNDNVVKTQARLTALQAHYQAMFTNLDTIVSKMTATSTYLTGQFAAMTKSNSSNN